jgi:hypothetical protein
VTYQVKVLARPACLRVVFEKLKNSSKIVRSITLLPPFIPTRDYSNYKIIDEMKESRENHNVVVMDRNFFKS